MGCRYLFLYFLSWWRIYERRSRTTQTPEVKETATPAPTIKPTQIPAAKLTEVTPSVHIVNKVKVYKGITYKMLKNKSSQKIIIIKNRGE